MSYVVLIIWKRKSVEMRKKKRKERKKAKKKHTRWSEKSKLNLGRNFCMCSIENE